MDQQQQAYDDAKWKNRFLEVIELCTSLYWQNDRTDFFRIIAGHLKDMTGAANVNIRLLSSTEDAFITCVSCGDADTELIGNYNVLSASAGRMPALMKTRMPIVFDFSNPQADDVAWDRGAQDGYEMAITVPFASEDRIEGVCDLLFHRQQDWDEDYLEWLTQLGRLVGTIIRNSLLADIQISMRLLDEHRRISSEIHDNLSQSINLIAFEAGNMQQSLEEGDWDHLARELSRLSKASDEAVKLLRGEMAQLYCAPEREFSLDSIRTFVEQFTSLWGLESEFLLEGDCDVISIPTRIGIQLIRILNEILTNVVRHSGATSVKVECIVRQSSISLCFIDNGCGFDMASVPPNRLGLRSMRERARAINGSISIESEVGKGTKACVFLPTLL